MNQQCVFVCNSERSQVRNCYSTEPLLSPPEKTGVFPQDLQLSYIYKLGNNGSLPSSIYKSHLVGTCCL